MRMKKRGKKMKSNFAKKGIQKVTDEKRNITWESNQKLLQEAYIELLQTLKRCPTTTEVSKKVNLSLKTIKLHVKELKFEPLENPLRSLTPDVIASIYLSAKNGSAQSQKLWMQIMEGWRDGIDISTTGKIRVDIVYTNITPKVHQDKQIEQGR